MDTVEDSLTTLVRKRKLEIDAQEYSRRKYDEKRLKYEKGITFCDLKCQKSENCKENQDKVKTRSEEGYGAGNFEDERNKRFTITKAVSTFIRLHGDTARLKKSLYHANDEASDKSIKIDACKTDEYHKIGDDPRLTMPSPTSLLDAENCSILISSTVFRDRRIVQEMRNLLPRTNMIERDFSSPHPMLLDPAARTAVWDICNEADVIISPGTGLVLTTLQRLRQRTLPGQASQSSIKGRLKALSFRYERIVLLISGCNMLDMDQNGYSYVLDENDCIALADISGYGAQLENEVIINYVPGKSKDLAKWIIAVMCKYRLLDGMKLNLMEDETMVRLRQSFISKYG